MESEKNAIREELGRLLSDPAFSGANRRSRLLRYLVEETLEDRGESLKESVIAADVFDRSPDYDPQVDSVVRVEVGRLRARLAEYYEKAGSQDAVRIEIPKGGYRPIFNFPNSVQKSPKPDRRWRWVAAIAAAGLLSSAALVWRTRVQPPDGTRTIAVLPFLNLSGNPAEEYLSDGISDELTEALAESRDLRVVARTSAFQYKGKGSDVREIGRNLRVGAVLEGSVTRRDDAHVRVIAQLIRTSDGYHLWSHTYDGTSSEIAQMENEIAEALRETLLPASPAPRREIAAQDPEAHDLSIRAAYDLNQHTAEATRQAIDLARQAAAKENSWAQPHVIMATAEMQLNTLLAQPADVSAKLAWDEVAKALAFDPENSRAHGLKALLAYSDRWDWPLAENEFRLALTSGSHAAAENLYGWCLMTRGRFAESRERLETASELDPLSLGPQLNQVEELIAERNYAEARRKVEEILRIAPTNPVALILGLEVAYWQKDCAAATAFNQKSLVSFPKVDRPTLGSVVADAACGRADEVARELEVLGKTKPADFPSPYLAAEAFALGNDASRAMSYLEMSAERREARLLQLKVDHVFEPMRQDPRFIALERRLGLF